MTNGISNEPRLSVEPEQLDFGAYQPRRPLSRQPILTLKITNQGEGCLQGRLISQVSWIILPKPEFQCHADETSLHTVQISTGAPQVVIRERYVVDQIIMIDSNAGSMAISGSYHIGLPSSSQKRRIGFAILSVLLVILTAAVLLLRDNLSGILPGQSSENHQALFTSGAETVLARVKESPMPAEISHSTPNIPRTTSRRTSAATVTQSIIHSTTSTRTPWPRETFPSPEEVVSKYYREINAGQYETAWSMLSRNFQQTCCAISGNDPFTIYSQWWGHNIEKVELNSAYLQKWDVNPAPVLVSISYYYKNGKIEDMIFMHYLIADADRNVLLIDEVR